MGTIRGIVTGARVPKVSEKHTALLLNYCLKKAAVSKVKNKNDEEKWGPGKEKHIVTVPVFVEPFF